MAHPIAIRGIHHLRLTVKDVTRSREFYTSLLGFDVAAEMPPPSESGMEEVARRRREIASRLEALERERRELFTQMRKAGASAADMAEQVRLMREEESSLRDELEPLAAQMALHQANLPSAEQVRALCDLFVKRATGASAATKRELLEALEVVVLLTGTRFRVEGVLGALGLEGDLTVQTCASSS